MAKLNNLIETEKRLLILKQAYRFQMTISEMVETDKKLSEIGKYTSKYFDICKEYASFVGGMTNAEQKLQEKSDKFMNEDIEYDYKSDDLFCEHIMGKYQQV